MSQLMNEDGHKNDHYPNGKQQKISGSSEENGDQPKRGMNADRNSCNRETQVITCGRKLLKKHDSPCEKLENVAKVI
jgi:hypothetical protein